MGDDRITPERDGRSTDYRSSTSTRRCATATDVAGTAAALIALPWLSVKYVPVAAALGAVVVWRLARSRRWPMLGAVTGVVVAAGIVYLVVHQRVYGRWTVYAHTQVTRCIRLCQS